VKKAVTFLKKNNQKTFDFSGAATASSGRSNAGEVRLDADGSPEPARGLVTTAVQMIKKFLLAFFKKRCLLT
jgi:hypothetical protein